MILQGDACLTGEDEEQVAASRGGFCNVAAGGKKVRDSYQRAAQDGGRFRGVGGRTFPLFF